MKIIALPDNSDLGEVARVQSNTQADYQQVIYRFAPNIQTQQQDLLQQLQQILTGPPQDCLEILEIDADGDPWICGCVDVATASDFGRNIAQLPLCPGGASIYLSGCNTGLGDCKNGAFDPTLPCMPRLLAQASGCTVFGTVGYLYGTHFDGSAECFPSLIQVIPTCHYPCAYPQPTYGDDCYRMFLPALVQIEELQIRIERKAMHTRLQLDVFQTTWLHAEMINTLRRPPKNALLPRVAPDCTIYIRTGMEESIYELLGRCILRRQGTNLLWQFYPGKTLLRWLDTPNAAAAVPRESSASSLGSSRQYPENLKDKKGPE